MHQLQPTRECGVGDSWPKWVSLVSSLTRVVTKSMSIIEEKLHYYAFTLLPGDKLVFLTSFIHDWLRLEFRDQTPLSYCDAYVIFDQRFVLDQSFWLISSFSGEIRSLSKQLFTVLVISVSARQPDSLDLGDWHWGMVILDVSKVLY